MYPHTPYFRGGALAFRHMNLESLCFGFGAPLVGGLFGGFLGSAIFNYPRPYYPPPPPPVPPPYGGGYPPYY